MNCTTCQGRCIRKGIRGGTQVYRCVGCGIYARAAYRNNACATGVDARITLYVREGCGIRSIARILGISPTTVIARIKRIAAPLQRPAPLAMGLRYEVDELATFCGSKKKRVWVAYALERKSRQVVAVQVGRRSKAKLAAVIASLLPARPARISTDALDIYARIIPNTIHHVHEHGINRIERHNLTLRTQLKRLARRSICFTRSITMLLACVKIHCWG